MHGNLYSDNLIERVRSLLADRRHALLSPGPVPSAVLLPLFFKEGDIHLLLTKRAGNLKHHAGEISFPGGVCNPGEKTRDTALRETCEEIGIEPSTVDILGTLDEVYSIHNYNVTPYVGYIPGNPAWRLNISEIDRVIEVPVAHLLNPSYFRIEEWGWQGRNYPVYFYRFQDEDIWGMTALIVMNFLDLVFRGDTKTANAG